MQDWDIMQLILCVLLLFSGFLCVLRITMQKAGRRTALPTAALFFFYVFIMGMFCLIILQFAGPVMLQLALMLLMSFMMAAAVLQRLARCRDRRSLLMALLLVGWLIATLLITFLTREPRDESYILLEFDALADMARKHSFAPVSHFLLNILLFVPLGVLLPLADREIRPCWLETLAAAIFLTALIESMQLIYHLGQSDVEDLLANVLGAVLGGLICLPFLPRSRA